jgi:uncharacterized protein (DUF1330 family)
MPKAYWIARVDMHDPETYKLYVEGAKAAFDKYGARFLVRGGKAEAVEGPGRSRNVVIEFDSLDIARACYNSPEYTAAKAYRQKASTGEIILVEGV